MSTDFGHTLRLILKLFRVLCSLILATVFPAAKTLRGQEIAPLTKAEQFVLQKVQEGKEADLTKFSAKPEERILGHPFIEKLLAGGYKGNASQVWAIKIENATFTQRVDAASETIPYTVWLTNCHFQQGVDFSSAKFAGDLSFQNSEFGSSSVSSPNAPADSSERGALFIGTQVNGSMVLEGAKFHVPLDFTYAQITGQFDFDNVRFETVGYADFNGLTTRAPAFFRHDNFSGVVALTDAAFFELFIEDTTFDLSKISPDAAELQLDRTRITRELSIRRTSFRWFQAQYLEVAGPTTFDGVTVSSRISLAHSRFQTLTVEDLAQWRQENNLDIDFEGLSFEGVDVPEANIEEYATRMLDLMSSERYKYYSPQPYIVLENFLRSHGNPEKADEVYIQMRLRERRELVYWKWPGDWLLEILVGYGRKPWRAIFYLLGLAVIGVIVFRKPLMQPQDSKDENPWYSPFWYSLDMLAPVIDLGQAKKWEPKPDHFWVRNYAQVQRIAGWILVPLILGAITGLIK